MSSRKYLSGAEKRKLKQQKENEAKNHPTIFKFLKPENDAKSNVTTHSSFNSDTMIENLETEIQVNNLDINSLNNYETELKLVANNSVSTNNVLMSSSNKIEISKDPGLWPETIDRFFREECIKLGSVFFQNRNKEYPASKRLFNSQNRFLSDNLFDRKMYNGDIITRKWLIYSESVGTVFCFPCKLFPFDSKLKSSFSKSGFNDWKHADELVSSHENSIEHKNAVSLWLICQNDNFHVDKSLLNHMTTETTYWIDVLKRVVAVVKFLCERRLSFRGCEAERSFSKLALIKNRLRSTQIEDRLNALTIMSIENYICKKLSFHDVLDTFASCKSRKKYFK